VSTITQPLDRARAADLGARITIERPRTRPGWIVVTAERARGTRRLWLAEDEAALLYTLLGRELPPVDRRIGGAA
jgi:hypothetical protein